MNSSVANPNIPNTNRNPIENNTIDLGNHLIALRNNSQNGAMELESFMQKIIVNVGKLGEMCKSNFQGVRESISKIEDNENAMGIAISTLAVKTEELGLALGDQVENSNLMIQLTHKTMDRLKNEGNYNYECLKYLYNCHVETYNKLKDDEERFINSNSEFRNLKGLTANIDLTVNQMTQKLELLLKRDQERTQLNEKVEQLQKQIQTLQVKTDFLEKNELPQIKQQAKAFDEEKSEIYSRLMINEENISKASNPVIHSETQTKLTAGDRKKLRDISDEIDKLYQWKKTQSTEISMIKQTICKGEENILQATKRLVTNEISKIDEKFEEKYRDLSEEQEDNNTRIKEVKLKVEETSRISIPQSILDSSKDLKDYKDLTKKEQEKLEAKLERIKQDVANLDRKQLTNTLQPQIDSIREKYQTLLSQSNNTIKEVKNQIEHLEKKKSNHVECIDQKKLFLEVNEVIQRRLNEYTTTVDNQLQHIAVSKKISDTVPRKSIEGKTYIYCDKYGKSIDNEDLKIRSDGEVVKRGPKTPSKKECWRGSKCKKDNCLFQHPNIKSFKHRDTNNSSFQCKYSTKCRNPKCRRQHGKEKEQRQEKPIHSQISSQNQMPQLQQIPQPQSQPIPNTSGELLGSDMANYFLWNLLKSKFEPQQNRVHGATFQL